MRNISFSLTLEAFKAGRKDVTRRLGWGHLKPGDRLMAVEKAQGIKKGQLVRLGAIEVVRVWRERLDRILSLEAAQERYGREEVIREGFPDMTPQQFVDMFCEHNTTLPGLDVTRIEFRRLFACSKCGQEIGIPTEEFAARTHFHLNLGGGNRLTCGQVQPLIPK